LAASTPPAPDEYLALDRETRAEIVARRSRFIAVAAPAPSADAAEELLAALRREHHAATHHCLAYRIGTANPETRASDDGEPAGTAGRPILAALERAGLLNCAIVVVRYFGGVKLGTGGLARAYAAAAAAVLEAAPVARMIVERELECKCPLLNYPAVISLLHRRATVTGEAFSKNEVVITVRIRLGEAEALKREAVEVAHGGVRWKN
jgi:uncharacterized YigZ family protein